MQNPIKFGTDGWRGIIAQDFTFDNVRVCAQGVADYLRQSGLAGRGFIVGYDTRFASEDFAAAATEVIAGNGIKVYLCPEATPTPVISYGVIARKTAGAVIITASHNKAAWNGFKYKSESGSSAPDDVTARIEAAVASVFTGGKVERVPLKTALEKGLVERLDLRPAYFEQVKRLVDLERLRRTQQKIVIEPMYGAGMGYLTALLEGEGLKLTEIDSRRNPLFPGMERPEPIAANLGKLIATVKRLKAGVGLALDGDADRMGIVDEKGNFLTQLQVFGLLCLYMLEVRGERGAIVKALTTTSMADRLGELFNVPVYETPVGFKNIAPIMMEQNALIGGEESGGYGFRGHVAERDGILANLYFLDFIARTGKTPSQLLAYLYSKVGPHHYERVDVEFPQSQQQAVIDRVRNSTWTSIDGVSIQKRDTLDGFRYVLTDKSWLLIRFSGTEPVLRIYCETDSPARAHRIVEEGRRLAGV